MGSNSYVSSGDPEPRQPHGIPDTSALLVERLPKPSFVAQTAVPDIPQTSELLVDRLPAPNFAVAEQPQQPQTQDLVLCGPDTREMLAGTMEGSHSRNNACFASVLSDTPDNPMLCGPGTAEVLTRVMEDSSNQNAPIVSALSSASYASKAESRDQSQAPVLCGPTTRKILTDTMDRQGAGLSLHKQAANSASGVDAQTPNRPSVDVKDSLLALGFSDVEATEAAKRTSSVEAAVEWVMAQHD